MQVREGEEKLVVEGWITNQKGSYKIRLGKTANYRYGQEELSLAFKGAIVQIDDSVGHLMALKEEPSGYYFTPKQK